MRRHRRRGAFLTLSSSGPQITTCVSGWYWSKAETCATLFTEKKSFEEAEVIQTLADQSGDAEIHCSVGLSDTA